MIINRCKLIIRMYNAQNPKIKETEGLGERLF